MELADRIVVMRKGHIAQEDTPGGLYARPATLEVAQFIGQMNVTQGTAQGGAVDWLGAKIEMPVAGDLALACRPEDLMACDHGIPADVVRVTDLGPLLRVQLMSQSGEALVWLTPREAAPQGRVRLWPRRLHVFRQGRLLDTITPQALVQEDAI